MDSQCAHGLQELEFIRKHSDTEAARLCVDQWLKMPGEKGPVMMLPSSALPNRMY